jgi:nitroimidazol reductase NimA-like FMN-containing flavoprotein (pyridoxamine 5'-phosphate oxidase superfamily)
MNSPAPFEPTPRTTVKRHPARASYDREAVFSILDEAPLCHIGFVADEHPVVIPTIHVRVDDQLVLHGSPAGRMMRVLEAGAPVSIAVTLLDGLVLARSVFNHSMNYRSVVVFGRGSEITDPEAKLEAMRVFTEKILPGRWDDARQPTDREVRATMMAAVPITETSAKIRTGPPVDEVEDYGLEVWAGEIPLEVTAGRPVPDPRLAAGIEFPAYLQHLLADATD